MGRAIRSSPRLTYAYYDNGNVHTITDRLNHTTEYTYDDRDRVKIVTNANDEDTIYTYYANSMLESLTDGETNTTTWFYDDLDRVDGRGNELNDSRFFEYDALGNLTKKTDRNERVTEYQYDTWSRMTHELWKNGGSTVRTLNYEYDNANQLTGADDPDAEYDYLYDNVGHVTSITADLAGLTPDVILAPQYNANGLRTVLQATIGSTADFKNDYEYDNLSRLKKLTQQDVGGGNTVADKRVEFTYNLAGQFDTITRHADLSGSSQIVATSTYAYDLTGRLDTLTHAKSGTTFAGYDFGYDAANRLTSFANSQASGENATYNYDAAGQLTDADYPSQTDEDYSYDDNGNRTTAVTTPIPTTSWNRTARSITRTTTKEIG